MSYFRQIHTLIWKDEDFLNFNRDEKLLFIYFFSNESTTLSGLYKMPLKVVNFETGLSMKIIKSALEKFESLEKIFYRDGYVFVKKFQFYNKGGQFVAISIKKELDLLPDCEIKRLYMQYIHPNIPYPYPMDTPSLSKEEKSKEKKSKEEENVAAVYKSYSDNIGMLTKDNSELIGADIDEYSYQWVLDAITEAVRQEKRSLAYVEGILKRWKRDGRSDNKKPASTKKTYKIDGKEVEIDVL